MLEGCYQLSKAKGRVLAAELAKMCDKIEFEIGMEPDRPLLFWFASRIAAVGWKVDAVEACRHDYDPPTMIVRDKAGAVLYVERVSPDELKERISALQGISPGVAALAEGILWEYRNILAGLEATAEDMAGEV